MKIFREKNGITLISLVVTIIVLLILAGVALVALNGDNGVLEQATKAKKETNISQDKEQIQLALNEWQIEKITNKKEFVSFLQETLKNSFIIDNGDGTVNVTLEGSELTYRVSENGAIEQLNENIEAIAITNVEQIYALGRILLNESTRQSTGINNFKTYLTDGYLQEDLALFEIPSQYVTDAEKINYLATTSYRLETDIDITFYNASNYAQYFMGIGDTENPFKGIFNGNGKNINITGCNIGTSSNYASLGFFGNTENALIKNCDINVNGNVLIKYNVKTLSFGILAGKINSSTIYNNTISLNNTVLGINYPEGTKYYNSAFLSTLIGTASGNSKIEKCIVNMNNDSELYIKHNNDELTKQYIVGGVVAKAEGTTTERINIRNCDINLENSKMYGIVPDYGLIGGAVGNAKYTDIYNTKVYLKNSEIGIEAIQNANNTSSYFSLGAGGIVGFANAGSDNTNNIGYTGVNVDSCSFTSENDNQKLILYAKETIGGAPNVGGIVAISFNNCIINNCEVDVKNGVLLAERDNENETISSYGSTIGGIIGRLEHTGNVKGCTVKGNNLKINAKSTEKEIYAGGIVGVDMGPAHKNLISIENCSFIGNNNSTIELEVIKGTAKNQKIFMGGISGQSTYIMKNCNDEGVNLQYVGAHNQVSRSAVGKITGYSASDRVGFWASTTYFTPDEIRGVIGCTSSNNVKINVSGSDSSLILVGDEYGLKE